MAVAVLAASRFRFNQRRSQTIRVHGLLLCIGAAAVESFFGKMAISHFPRETGFKIGAGFE